MIFSRNLWLAVLTVVCQSLHASPLYDQVIYTQPGTDDLLNASVRDLQRCLESATGKTFRVMPYTGKVSGGIYLLLNAPNMLSSTLQKQLAAGTIEDFAVTGDEQRLLLVARDPTGLSRAIYSYLDKLGMRWYFPGDLWTYTPQLNNITWQAAQLVSPSFNLRDFAGTGGLVPMPSLDPQQKLAEFWNDYKRRNRMGGEVQLSGHYGEVFNTKHQAELQAHPEYMALVNGRRGPWSATVKWCISNPALRKLFVQDRVEEAKQALARSGTQKKIVLSVDPADGYEDCTCPVCAKMGSYSDRIFLLASETAEALKNISPNLYVNLYAYNTHAAVPAARLSSHVIVQVIPYAFQNVAAPQDLITAWKKKVDNLLIYDYYGIPDWSDNLPQDDRELVKKLHFWKASGIKGFMLESSNSIGSTGYGLYMAARIGWNSATDADQEKTAFLNNMFGRSAPIMRQYYEKLASYGGAADIPYLLQLLAQAGNGLTGKQKDRVSACEAYLHFLLLYDQYKNATAQQQAGRWEAFVSFNWRLYFTGLVHSTRMGELWIYNHSTNIPNAKNWDPHGADAQQLRKIAQLTMDEADAIARNDLRQHPVLEDFATTASKLNYELQKAPADEKNPAGMILLDIPEIYIRGRANGSAHLLLRVNDTPDDNLTQSVTVDCFDTVSNTIVQSRTVSLNRQWSEVTFSGLNFNRSYRLLIKNKNWIRLYAPLDQWMAFRSIPFYTMMGTLYFYLPAGTRYLYFSSQSDEQPVFLDPSRKKVVAEKAPGEHLYRIPVQPGMTGLWTVDATDYKRLQFYNRPGLFFMHGNYISK